MKKLVAWMSVVALTLTMSLSAFALPSPTVSGFVKGIRSAVDATGRSINIVVQTVSEAQNELTTVEKQAIENIKKEATLRQVLGSEWKDGMKLVDIRNVKIDGDASSVKFPVTITFDVPGVKANSNVVLLVFNGETGKWEVVHCKVGNGTVTATFDFLGLVAFVVDADTANNIASTVTSPKTGEPDAPIDAGIAIVAALGGVFLLAMYQYKKGNALSE